MALRALDSPSEPQAREAERRFHSPSGPSQGRLGEDAPFDPALGRSAADLFCQEPCIVDGHDRNMPTVDTSRGGLWMTLDDGANTTCHSQQWAARAEEYLAHFGLRLDWISTKTRTFKGLGGALTKSLGKRRIPCVFLATARRSLASLSPVNWRAKALVF